MPTYVYVCPDDHQTEKYRGMSHREDPVDCKDCGAPAVPMTRRGSRPDMDEKNTRAVGGLYDAESGRRYYLRALDCSACEYDEVTEAWMDDDGSLMAPPACPSCGAACKWEHLVDAAISTALDRHFNDGGGHDMGLDMHFSSKQEWREHLKRSGLECVHGETSAIAKESAKDLQRENAAIKRDHNEYIDNLERDPEGRAALAHLRRQAAQGAFGPGRKNSMLERMK